MSLTKPLHDEPAAASKEEPRRQTTDPMTKKQKVPGDLIKRNKVTDRKCHCLLPCLKLSTIRYVSKTSVTPLTWLSVSSARWAMTTRPTSSTRNALAANFSGALTQISAANTSSVRTTGWT